MRARNVLAGFAAYRGWFVLSSKNSASSAVFRMRHRDIGVRSAASTRSHPPEAFKAVAFSAPRCSRRHVHFDDDAQPPVACLCPRRGCRHHTQRAQCRFRRQGRDRGGDCSTYPCQKLASCRLHVGCSRSSYCSCPVVFRIVASRPRFPRSVTDALPSLVSSGLRSVLLAPSAQSTSLGPPRSGSAAIVVGEGDPRVRGRGEGVRAEGGGGIRGDPCVRGTSLPGSLLTAGGLSCRRRTARPAPCSGCAIGISGCGPPRVPVCIRRRRSRR